MKSVDIAQKHVKENVQPFKKTPIENKRQNEQKTIVKKTFHFFETSVRVIDIAGCVHFQTNIIFFSHMLYVHFHSSC